VKIAAISLAVGALMASILYSVLTTSVQHVRHGTVIDKYVGSSTSAKYNRTTYYNVLWMKIDGSGKEIAVTRVRNKDFNEARIGKKLSFKYNCMQLEECSMLFSHGLPIFGGIILFIAWAFAFVISLEGDL
jgi:hypothetical protein